MTILIPEEEEVEVVTVERRVYVPAEDDYAYVEGKDFGTRKDAYLYLKGLGDNVWEHIISEQVDGESQGAIGFEYDSYAPAEEWINRVEEYYYLN